MKALVTGGLGFIGKYFIKKLLDNNFNVVNIDKSHVDNSIDGSQKFVESNIFGTQNLLELIRNKPKYDRPKFIHISTDEVYGDIENGFF